MNDWLVANLNNPDFTVSDFKDIVDMSLDNTQFLKKDQYLKSDFIKNNSAFKDNNGEFSQKKFDQFYDTQLKRFQDFKNDKTPSGLALDIFDVNRTPNSKVLKNEFRIGKGYNPDRQKIGIEGVNVWSAPEKSKSEIAQSQKIFNYETGKFEDWTPEDNALFNGKSDFGLSWLKSLFSDPLVLAQYDEDTVDKDGTKHKKGDYKLNNEGTYYYETLGGRSPIGKQVLSALDTLTVEGSNLNKYDFFDSDDIEKSVGGIIAKNVATLLPMFIGGPVGAVYSTALIAREMAKAMPMLYGMTTALFSDSDTPKWMNTIAAMGTKFTSGTSDYAKEHTFSVENFGNMISDVALQWGQQKGIANAINKLRGSKNYMEEAVENAEKLYKMKASSMPMQAAADPKNWQNSILGQACLKKYLPAAEKAMKESTQLGRDASLAYMAIVSNSDVYGDLIQQGTSKKEAAAVALGSTLGMFAVDKYAGLGELFFDDATEESVKATRKAVKNELLGFTDDKGVKHKGIQEILGWTKQSNDTDANKIVQIIHKAADITKSALGNYADDLKYHTTGFLGKAVGEGLEEVGEELVTDTAKSIYQLAGYLGADTSVKDVGAWDNALERYSMSFLGGAVGGGIFYAKEAIDGSRYKQDKSNEELVTLIRNGHIDELRDEVEKLKSKGKLGSRKLSASKVESTTDGQRVWLTTNDEEDSQNNRIADLINQKINSLDAVINNNQIGLTDDQLFKNMVMGEQRYLMYQDVAPITNYYEDFNQVISDLIKAELDFKTASKTLNGTINTSDSNMANDERLRHLTPEQQNTRNQNLQLLQQKIDKARQAKDEFLSGDTSLDYTRKLNFALDPNLHAPFMDIDEEQLWKDKFGNKTMDEISDEDKLEFLTVTLPNARKFQTKEKLTQSWDRFKQLEKVINPELHTLTDNADQYKQWYDKFQNIVKQLDSKDLIESYINYDTKLDTESDDEYNARNTKLIDSVTGQEESDDDFINRKNNRIRQIEAVNDQKDADWANTIMQALSVVGNQLDPISASTLKKVVPKRVKDIISRKVELSPLSNDIKGILKGLNNNLDNVKDIQDTIKNSLIAKNNQNTKQYAEQLDSILNKYDLDITTLYTLQEESDAINGSSLIGDLIDNPDFFIFYGISSEDNVKIHDLLTKIGQLVAYNTEIIDIDPEYSNFSSKVEQVLKPKLQNINNEINSVVADVGNNALFKLHNSIQSSIKNPVIELVKSLTGKVLDKSQMPDVISTLENLDTDFANIEDIGNLVLDAEQMKSLQNTKDALSLIATYLYAASSTSTGDNVIGHNKVMNEYARKHSDRVQNWEELPEIDEDYAAIYQQQLNTLIQNIDSWINLSNNNDINKRKQFEDTDKALTRSFNESWQVNKQHFVIDVKDKHYNLLDGAVDDNNPDINLFNYEKAFYSNFQKALNDSGLSVADFLKESKILDKLTSFKQLTNQKVTRLSPKINYNQLTEFDKIQYLATLMSLNPVDYYNYLKSNVANNADKAPIASQEYASKVAIAQTTQTYRDIMEYAFDKSGNKLYNANNTVVITGDAGSGKTSVVGKSVIDFLNPDTKILCVGPTDTQALGLVSSFNKGKSMDIETLMRKLLGDDIWLDFKSDLNIKVNSKTGVPEKESKFFDIWGDDFTRTKLKDNLTFKTLDEIPNIIAIDEATHIPAPVLQVLDAYMKSTGGTLMLLGDSKQRSYAGENNGIGNMRSVDLFASRTPELNVSLRDNNIQKQANLNNVKTLLGEVLTNLEDMSEPDLEAYWKVVDKLIPKIKFRVYNQGSLAGDLITKQLTPELIDKLRNGDVGFIGDKSSAAYQALIDAGLKPSVLSMDQMQGQEFDYVVIDQPFTKPTADYKIRNFLQDLYTLMSRGKTASIFIDNGLSSIIGGNIEDNYTAKAPSLNDKTNGKSTIDILKERKLDILNQLDLSPIQINGQPITSQSNTQQTPTEPAVVPEDFKNPDELNIDKEVIPLVTNLEEESSESNQLVENTVPTNLDIPSEFSVMSFGDVTYMGVKEVKEKHKGKDGKEYEGNAWHFNKDGELRNLSAITDQNSVFWYSDKLELQKQLYQVKSALIFNHSYDEMELGTRNRILPTCITSNFSKVDWEAGTYELEIRPVDGEVQPLFAPMKEMGMTYKGNKYIANIIFKVKNKKGQICKFDLAGINNPETLNKNLGLIKSNLLKQINDPKVPEERRNKLQNIHDTIDTQAVKWSNLFDSWINQFNKDGSFSIDISNAIIRQKKTWFTKRTGPEIRLGGRIDPNDIDGTKNKYQNLKDRNPGMVFSDIYTFTGNQSANLDIDPSIKGKAVVFISSDTLLKPEELVHKYIAQKQDSEHNNPTVRMIVLHNYGLSFSDMCSDEFISKIQGGDETRLPYRANYHGIQMFVSMWNWRASLNKFNQALQQWMSDNKYDLNKVHKLIHTQNLIYNKQIVTNLDKFLESQGITKEDLANLDKFNQDICKEIPIFRLGYSGKNGFHIQRFNVEGSQAYKGKKEANLIVVNPEKAQTFYTLLNRILGGVSPSSLMTTLNLQLMHPGKINPDGTRENATPWGEDEFIDIDNANHQRSLSGLFTSDLQIQYNGIDVIYKQGEQWSAIPKLLSNILRTTTFFQYNPDQLSGQYTESAKVSYKEGEETKKVTIQLGDLFADGVLKTKANSSEQGHPDRSLADMFDLMFHGTTEDIHRPYNKNNPLVKADDARFPNGFYINPDISRTKESANSTDIVKVSVDKEAIFYPIKTSDELFTSDNDLRAAGIDLSIDKLLNMPQQTQNVSTNQNINQLTSQNVPSLPAILTLEQREPNTFNMLEVSKSMGFNYSEFEKEEAAEELNQYFKNNIVGILQNSNADTVLNTVVKYTTHNIKDTETETLQDIIKQTVKGDFTLQLKSEDGKQIIVVESQGNEYELNTNNWTLKDTTPRPILTKFDQKVEINGEWQSIYNALQTILNSQEFISQIKNDAILTDFTKELANIYNNIDVLTKDQIDAQLKNIKLNWDYIYINGILQSNYTDIYNKLFEC